VTQSIATFSHLEFADLGKLLELKQRQKLTVSLCIPTFNEEETIGGIVSLLRAALVEGIPLLDELAIIDSGSADATCEAARAAGADVHAAAEILPEAGPARGKGENVWKAVHQLKGDILVFIDGDVRNMHPRFVYGTLGVLLQNPAILYAKGFYDRKGSSAEIGVRPAGGGRVTEALVRPLFSLFFPELAGLVQPLAGEYAARREALETLSMPSGYGVETAHLIDIAQRCGAHRLAQCDLEERVHRHQDTASLGRMSFAILHAFFQRARVLSPGTRLSGVYRHFVRENGVMRPEESPIADLERPPLRDLPAYQARRRSLCPPCA